MKKWLAILVGTALIMTGCVPALEKEEKIVQEKDDKIEKAIIPHFQISDQYYRTILPFKPGKARGMVVSNLNSRYDISEFENGLMRIAQETFSPDTYLFQEGQYLEGDVIKLWLNRKYTDAQLKEKDIDPSENIGLNPALTGEGTIEEQNNKSPIYLAHVLEHNYLKKDEESSVSLEGIVIGLAMNSVHYYQNSNGATLEQEISHDELEKQGKEIAKEVLNRLRSMDGLQDIPIVIALFEQESRTSVVPGRFIAYTSVGKGSNSIDNWKNINQQYYLLPSSKAEDAHRQDVETFLNFKQEIERYFPHFNGVIGRAFYQEEQLMELNVDIPIQFNGEAELIGFTQWVAGLAKDHLPNNINLEINISSLSGQGAIIIRKPNENEPFVHIYQ